MSETTVTIETPPVPEVPETVIETQTETIVAPVVDMAVLLGELRSKVETLESALSTTIADCQGLRSHNEYLTNEISSIRTLMAEPEEPEVIVEETPPEDLPIETLPEIEIVPEVPPEVESQVQKRKRFFV